MAIMRSEVKSGGGDWLGIKTGSLTKVTDESHKYDWADVYLLVEFMVEGSEYPRVMKVTGSWEKNPDGTIQDCPLLKRVTFLFDALSDMGGVNQHGEWCDSNEQKIDDICDYLMANYKDSKCTIYVYRELAKNGNAYTRVHNKILKAGNGSEKELESYITFMKSKGYLKEAPADHQNGTAATQTNVGSQAMNTDGIDIANL
jgi:hypothetical protein